MRTLLISILVLPLFGCALLTDEMTRSAEKAQEAIDYWCLASQENRAAFRGSVNPTPAGNSAVITCIGDS